MSRLTISPRVSALAGIFGPVVFVIVYTFFGLVTPGYSQLTQVISNLELAPNGWIQQLNFLQCGTLIIVFALGFRGAMLLIIQRHLRLSTALLALSGAGMVEASYFTPADPVQHAIGFLLFIIPLTAAFFLVGRQLLGTDSWRALGAYTLASGFVTSALLLYFFSLGASESFGLIGVVNRLFVTESLAWFVVMGTRLLGVSGSGPEEMSSLLQHDNRFRFSSSVTPSARPSSRPTIHSPPALHSTSPPRTGSFNSARKLFTIPQPLEKSASAISSVPLPGRLLRGSLPRGASFRPART